MNQLDVIVIGAGIGGLTTAALLQHRGLSTLTLEQHTVAGGSASLFRKKGYTFDAGASMFYGFGKHGTGGTLNLHRRIFELLGIEVRTVFDPVQIHYHLPDADSAGHFYSVRTHYDREKFFAELIQKFPHESEGIRKFYDELEAVYDIISSFPAGSLEDVAHLAKLGVKHPKKVYDLARFTFKSMGKTARAYITDENLLRFIDIECYAWAVQDATATPLVNAGICLADRHHGGINYPIGSSGAIAKALVDGIEKFGGEVILGRAVSEIIIRNGKAIGVRMESGKEYFAKAVVSNATVWDTFGTLVKDEKYKVDESKFITAPSWFQLHLGVDANVFPEGFEVHHIIVEDWNTYQKGGTIRLSAPSLIDPSLAPAGKHVLHAFNESTADQWTKRFSKDPDYETAKEQYADDLIARVSRVLPGLKDAIDLRFIATPLTHKRYLRRYQGSYGPLLKANQIVLQKPQNTTPVDDLYAVGDSCFPGQGVIAVTYSGISCAHIISKKFGVKFEYV
ncbi:MAG: FAD-dependent oxidoreductase [Rhizobacter sp.]|nr:FAD-dependent oxidoreductase [Chlorobiales bacterium]